MIIFLQIKLLIITIQFQLIFALASMFENMTEYQLKYKFSSKESSQLWYCRKNDQQFVAKLVPEASTQYQKYKNINSNYVQECLTQVKYQYQKNLKFKKALIFKKATSDLREKLWQKDIPVFRLYKFIHQISLGLADLHRAQKTHGMLTLDHVLYFKDTDSVSLHSLHNSHCLQQSEKEEFERWVLKDMYDFAFIIFEIFGLDIEKRIYMPHYQQKINNFFTSTQSDILKRMMKYKYSKIDQFIKQFDLFQAKSQYIDKSTSKVYYSKSLYKAIKKIRKPKQKNEKKQCGICTKMFNGKNLSRHIKICQRKKLLNTHFENQGYCSKCHGVIKFQDLPYKCCAETTVRKTLKNVCFPNPFRNSKGSTDLSQLQLKLPQLPQSTTINVINYQYSGNSGKFIFTNCFMYRYCGEAAEKLDTLRKRERDLPLQRKVRQNGSVGLFTTKDFQKNTLICWLLGEVIDVNECDPQKDDFLFKIGGTRDACLIIAPKKIINHGRYINQSTHPNACYRKCLIQVKGQTQLCVFFFTITSISANEEIYWNSGHPKKVNELKIFEVNEDLII